MTKIVYNSTYGGFNLSDEAVRLYAELKGITLYPETTDWGAIIYWLVPVDPGNSEHGTEPELQVELIERTDPVLAEVVERLGEAANINGGRLLIRELPAGTRYRIDEYDGSECVITMEEHRWKVA